MICKCVIVQYNAVLTMYEEKETFKQIEIWLTNVYELLEESQRLIRSENLALFLISLIK